MGRKSDTRRYAHIDQAEHQWVQRLGCLYTKGVFVFSYDKLIFLLTPIRLGIRLKFGLSRVFAPPNGAHHHHHHHHLAQSAQQRI